MLTRSRTIVVALVLSIFTAPFMSAAATCPMLTRTVSRNATGPDVRSLQVFLADRNFLETKYVIGVYGLKTEKAVQAFQTEQGIVSSGTAATTGYGAVGAKTRLRISAICASGTRSNATAPSTGTSYQLPMQTYAAPLPSQYSQAITPALSTVPSLELGIVSADAVMVHFFAMPPATHIVMIEPVSGKRVEAGGFSPLTIGGNGHVSFPMLGEFAGNTYAFQAQSSSTQQKIADSAVFTVPKPPTSSNSAPEQTGTLVILDGEVTLFTFGGITRTNAESRCKTEKANNPMRNTRCTFNGASILF